MKIPTIDLTWLLRYWLGIMMVFHSYDTIFISGFSPFAGFIESIGIPFPKVMAYVAKLSEFLGGICLLIHFQTRLFSGLIAVVMIVAAFVGHKGLILTEGELAFNYLLLAILIFFHPNGSPKFFKK